MKDRTRLNLIMGVLYPMETLVANFFVKQAVRFQLGPDYLGLQTVYTNFCDILTFAFAGLGIAMMFRLYKPIEDGDEVLVGKMFHYFDRIYRYFVIGGAAVGALFTGLVVLSVNAPEIGVTEVAVGFLMYLLSSLIYNRYYIYYFYLSAWQMRYEACLIHSLTDLLALIIEIGSLVIFKNYLVFLGTIVVKNVVEALIIYAWSNRQFPFLKENISAAGPETKGAFNDAKHMIIAKIGNLLVGSTDSILISGLVSTFAAGCYSGYYFLYLGLTTVTSSFYESIMNKVGKQLVTRTRDSQFRHFIKISVMNIAIAALVVNGFYHLCDDFITLWMGSDLLLGRDIIILVSVNLFMCISRHSVSIYRQSAGLFSKASWMILIWGVFNLILSVILGFHFGMFGILIATSISNYLTIYWYEPYIVYKFFNRSFLYAVLYEVLALLAVISTILITGPVIALIPADNWLMLIVKAAACMGLSLVWAAVILGIPGYFYMKAHPEKPDSEPEEKELVSVIISIYNVAPYLPDCLDSVLAQTYKNMEIILVDDGSEDGGGEICERYAQKDPRVRVIHQKNRGLSAARNAGTGEASGRYLGFVDGDDVLHPEYISYLYNILKSTAAEAAVVDYRVFRKKKSFEGSAVSWQEPEILTGKQAAEKIIISHDSKMITSWGKLYDRSLREDLHYPEGRIHEDEFITYQVFYHLKQVAVGNMKLYGLRKREGSITSGYSARRLDKLDALQGSISWLAEHREEQLSEYARLRYILNIEIAWYNVYTKMQNEKELEERLIRQHEEAVSAYWDKVKSLASPAERMAVAVFGFRPKLYRFFAGLYLILEREHG